MTTTLLVAVVVAAALFVYLVVAMFKPEWFA
jgi:K+-transporting ATPase KdpF subunit